MPPARLVPVAPEIRGVERHHHDVAGARADLLQAPGTQVRLVRLERMDHPDLDRSGYRGMIAHSRIITMTAKAAPTMT
jgi:hypothetical protein